MVTFTERDDIREGYGKPRKRFSHPGRSAQALATSGAGIVHRKMMDLQRQPELNKEDTSRLKELRRDWNRNRKFTDAGMAIAGVSNPQDAMKYYRDITEDFRQLNKPAYNKMYPITGNFMDYTAKGGIWGAIISKLLGKGTLESAESAILNGDGIGGAVDSEEAIPEILQNYADQTFGPINIHDDEFTDTENWYDDRKDVVIPPMDDDYGDFYINEDTLAGPRFDDSARERAIMEQYPESFIGPPRDPSWRPNMMDVAGKGINRGLFPYPGYNEEVTVAPPPFYGGRGEMPGMESPYYYDQMREGYEFGNLINEDDGASLFDTTKKKFKNRDEYNEWLNMKRQYGFR